MTTVVILVSSLAVAALGYAIIQHRAARAARAEADEARARASEAMDAAEAAALARESFFDLATHELRSPLAAILGYQELIQDGAYGTLDPAAAEPMERIGRSARHLLQLIEGVVELSRIRGGALEPDLEPVNLQGLLSGLAETFRERAGERNIEAEVSVPDALPTARTDLDRLRRALDLVVTSAVKHPGGDSLQLVIGMDADRALTVAIHGTAIEVRDHDDPALRLGIRLAIASGIARLLGGDLDLDVDDRGIIRDLVFRIHAPSPGTPEAFDDARARG